MNAKDYLTVDEWKLIGFFRKNCGGPYFTNMTEHEKNTFEIFTEAVKNSTNLNKTIH